MAPLFRAIPPGTTWSYRGLLPDLLLKMRWSGALIWERRSNAFPQSIAWCLNYFLSRVFSLAELEAAKEHTWDILSQREVQIPPELAVISMLPHEEGFHYHVVGEPDPSLTLPLQPARPH